MAKYTNLSDQCVTQFFTGFQNRAKRTAKEPFRLWATY